MTDIVQENLNLKQTIQRLEEENKALKQALAAVSIEQPKRNSPELSNYVSTTKLSAQEKLALYGSLFKGRMDVYATRWENKAARSGYTPACDNEWVKPLCQKPRIKCSQCQNKKLSKLTEHVLFKHLTGGIIVLQRVFFIP